MHALHMKERLENIWASSMKTSDELLKELQQWCLDAQKSGILALDMFAKRIATMQLARA